MIITPKSPNLSNNYLKKFDLNDFSEIATEDVRLLFGLCDVYVCIELIDGHEIFLKEQLNNMRYERHAIYIVKNRRYIRLMVKVINFTDHYDFSERAYGYYGTYIKRR